MNYFSSINGLEWLEDWRAKILCLELKTKPRRVILESSWRAHPGPNPGVARDGGPRNGPGMEIARDRFQLQWTIQWLLTDLIYFWSWFKNEAFLEVFCIFWSPVFCIWKQSALWRCDIIVYGWWERGECMSEGGLGRLDTLDGVCPMHSCVWNHLFCEISGIYLLKSERRWTSWLETLEKSDGNRLCREIWLGDCLRDLHRPCLENIIIVEVWDLRSQVHLKMVCWLMDLWLSLAGSKSSLNWEVSAPQCWLKLCMDANLCNSS